MTKTDATDRPNEEPARRCIDVVTAAHCLGLSRTVVYELLFSGELRSIKVGGRRLVPVLAIDAFIADQLARQHGLGGNES